MSISDDLNKLGGVAGAAKAAVNDLKTAVVGDLLGGKVVSPALRDTPAGLNQLAQQRGLGTFDAATTLAYFGNNVNGTLAPVPINTDQYGMTFFTRPRLNLSYDNVTQDRVFASMLTNNSKTVERAVRAILDPVGSCAARGGPKSAYTGRRITSADDFLADPAYPSPLIDDLNPFICLLSNTLISMTGWPDPVFDVYTAKEGVYRETWSQIDSFAKNYGAFDLTANFRNIVGDPITYLFTIWTQYGARVREGFFDPYPDMILNNEIDYQTRIYRLIMDPTRTYVQKIGACGAAFPTSDSSGAAFNFDHSKPFNPDLDQISVTFRCLGAIYYDPILAVEFNKTMAMFNPGMLDATRGAYFTKVPIELRQLFNYKVYPRIDPVTMELEWYARNADYKSITAGL